MSVALRRWDVVVVPFPYIDRPMHKKRPALIISDADFHDAFGTCWAMMITSARRSSWDCDITLDPDAAGLPLPCVLRPAKLASADIGCVIRRLGSIQRSEQRKVSAFLEKYFSGLL